MLFSCAVLAHPPAAVFIYATQVVSFVVTAFLSSLLGLEAGRASLLRLEPDAVRRRFYTRIFKWVVAYASWKFGGVRNSLREGYGAGLSAGAGTAGEFFVYLLISVVLCSVLFCVMHLIFVSKTFEARNDYDRFRFTLPFAGIAKGGSNALNTTVNSSQLMPASSPGKYKVTGSMGKVPAHLVIDFTFSYVCVSAFVVHNHLNYTLRLLFHKSFNFEFFFLTFQ